MPEPDHPALGLLPQLAHDLLPERHLSRLAGLTRPRIVIVGDSIATDSPGITHDLSDSFWGHFQRAVLLANPGVQPEFLNRAIGKARFSQFERATLGQTFAAEGHYPWATDMDERWLSHVENLRPDLLIQAFGMNDAGEFNTQGFIALQRRIDDWIKQPDRLYVPTMMPSRASDRPEVSGPEGQAGRAWNAHYVRSWALFNGYGLIDLGRIAAQAVQGIDPRVSDMVRERGAAESLPSTGRNPGQDFGVVLESRTLGADLTAGLNVQLGARSPAREDMAELRLKRDGQGQVVAEFADLAGALGVYMRHRCPECPQAPKRLSVFVRDVFAHIEVDGQTLFHGRIRRHGGAFQPVIARADGAEVPAKVTHFFGRPRQHRPVLTDAQAFGANERTVHRFGGNAINHPSSLMGSMVFAPLTEALALTIPRPASPVAPTAAAGGLLNRLRG